MIKAIALFFFIVCNVVYWDQISFINVRGNSFSVHCEKTISHNFFIENVGSDDRNCDTQKYIVSTIIKGSFFNNLWIAKDLPYSSYFPARDIATGYVLFKLAADFIYINKLSNDFKPWIDGRRIPSVFYVKGKPDSIIFSVIPNRATLNGEISSDLRLADFAGGFGQNSSFNESPDNGSSPNGPEYNRYTSKPYYSVSSSGHGLLGAKVLAIIIFGVPFTIFWFETGSRIRPSRKWDPIFVVFWIIGGVAVVIAGSVWAVI